MKKIDISQKAKKRLIIAGSAVFCIGVAVAALTLTAGTPSKAVTTGPVSSSSTGSFVLSVDPIDEDSKAESESQAPAFNPVSGASQTTELTKIEKPTSAPPAPVIEGDSSKTSDGKETEPTNSALTDKTKKPTYTSKPTAKKSDDTTTKNSNSAGDNDPVFGNTQAPHGQMTTVGNPGDELTGNKVGIMD
ncbi:DUF6550 family protein [Caproiciproducens sp. LBM24188]